MISMERVMRELRALRDEKRKLRDEATRENNGARALALTQQIECLNEAIQHVLALRDEPDGPRVA